MSEKRVSNVSGTEISRYRIQDIPMPENWAGRHNRQTHEPIARMNSAHGLQIGLAVKPDRGCEPPGHLQESPLSHG